jgi:hypothetical protein
MTWLDWKFPSRYLFYVVYCIKHLVKDNNNVRSFCQCDLCTVQYLKLKFFLLFIIGFICFI